MKRLSRRTFLRGAGVVAIGLPVLDIRDCHNTSAVNTFGQGLNGLPKRLVIVYSANGTVYDQWLPSASGTASSPILSPLAPYQNDLLVLDGIFMNSRQS